LFARIEQIIAPGDGGAQLRVIHPDGRIEERRIDRATYTIGSAADNLLVLNDPATAPHHIEIVSDGRRCQVLDLGSPAGTALNGYRIYALNESGAPIGSIQTGNIAFVGPVEALTINTTNQPIRAIIIVAVDPNTVADLGSDLLNARQSVLISQIRHKR
jgi:pSer/pThr/pTyr-binding forkhead associated (FHA) protein